MLLTKEEEIKNRGPKMKNKSAASKKPTTLKRYELIIAYIYGFYNMVKDFTKTEKGKTILTGTVCGITAFAIFEIIYQIINAFYLFIIWR